MFCGERDFYVNALFNLREKLSRSKRYRESWAAAIVKRMIPLQIRVLRKEREWSQADLAKESQLTQGVISRAEDPNYGNLSINTLVRIAAGFDCAFIVRFVPFSELGRWYTQAESEKALSVASFQGDGGFEPWRATLLSGHFVNSNAWQWESLTVTQTAEVSSVSSVWPIPKKEPRAAMTPNPQGFLTLTAVQAMPAEYAEGH
jgi:transcriptional regulator with XRE-family HTH domain